MNVSQARLKTSKFDLSLTWVKSSPPHLLLIEGDNLTSTTIALLIRDFIQDLMHPNLMHPSTSTGFAVFLGSIFSNATHQLPAILFQRHLGKMVIRQSSVIFLYFHLISVSLATKCNGSTKHSVRGANVYSMYFHQMQHTAAHTHRNICRVLQYIVIFEVNATFSPSLPHDSLL